MGTRKAKICREKFLGYFPKGFQDPKYIDWERGYKEEAHNTWSAQLGRKHYKELLELKHYNEIAATVVRIESRTNLLFSFEKMALRDAVRCTEGAMEFAKGLYAYLYGRKEERERFEGYTELIDSLPRKQTRVLTWPIVTIFPFLAEPEKHIFLKPNVTKQAAEAYGYSFRYESRPQWEVYQSYLKFAAKVKEDLKDLKPRDMIDIQSFMWVLGSDEYPWKD